MTSTSVPSADIVATCVERGYLAKQLYVIFTRPTQGIEPVMKNLGPHLAYQEKLEMEGIMFAAGPNWTDDGLAWEGDGMVVYRASSMAEATAIAAADPMHASGARNFTVRPWLVNEGTITIQLGFATGKFTMK